MHLLIATGPDAASLALTALCIAAQDHKAWEVREEACNTLRELGEKTQEILTILVRVAVGDAYQTVRLAAVRALQRLFKKKSVAEKLKEAASDISSLIAELAEAGLEFRRLRQELQKVYERACSTK